MVSSCIPATSKYRQAYTVRVRNEHYEKSTAERPLGPQPSPSHGLGWCGQPMNVIGSSEKESACHSDLGAVTEPGPG